MLQFTFNQLFFVSACYRTLSVRVYDTKFIENFTSHFIETKFCEYQISKLRLVRPLINVKLLARLCVDKVLFLLSNRTLWHFKLVQIFI